MALFESTWTVLLAGLVSANLPFVSRKFLFFYPLEQKGPAWCLLELLVWMILVMLLGVWIEGRIGNIFPKRWEFYAVFTCLFLVAAFPGFVWRFLRKGERG